MLTLEDYDPEYFAAAKQKITENRRNTPNCDERGIPLHGIYDDRKQSIRFLYHEGILIESVNSGWVKSSALDKPKLTNMPWESYPDIPRK